MNLMIASDNNYVSPALVLLESVFENNDCDIEIWYLFAELSAQNIKAVKNLVEKRWEKVIHFIKVDEEIFAKMPICAHFTKETYFRLIATKVLPQSIDRILYLDPDIIVNKNIENFYSQDLEIAEKKYLFVACEDRYISENKENLIRLDIPEKSRYFNAGVLILNLNYLRQIFDEKAIFDYISEKGSSLIYCDQDVLNAFFYDKVKYCDSDYNLLICNVKSDSKKINNASILHYAGSHKPWNSGYNHGAYDIYYNYVIKANQKAWFYKSKFRSLLKTVPKKIKRAIKR